MDLERLTIERGEDQPTRQTARRRRRAGGLGWLVFLLLIIGAGYLFRAPLLRGVDRLRLPQVSVIRVLATTSLDASAVSGTAANGYIVARHRAALSADTPGRIVEMNVEEGTVVHKGDIVARLYADEFEASLKRAEADLTSSKSSLLRAEADAQASRAKMVEHDSRVVEAGARVEESESSERLALANYERIQNLAKRNVSSQDEADRALTELERSKAQLAASRAALATAKAGVATGKTNVKVAEAAVAEARSRIAVYEAYRDLAQATLDKTLVRAPFDGIVVLKDAEVGEVVSPNSLGGNSRGSVATMVDFASLEVQVEVQETSLSAVEIGGPTNIYLDAFPDQLYKGRVERVWPTANRQKATVEVRIAFEQTDERLRPEMGVRVVFSPEESTSPVEDQVEAETRILIPSTALARVDGRTGAFVLERDVARFREVQIGGESSGRVLVTAGLESGERIIAEPPATLNDGDRVRIKE